MFLRRLFGGESAGSVDADPDAGSATASAHPAVAIGETETVRRIVASLEAMPPDEARYLAGFAYILGRAAAADLDISAVETGAMEQIVMEHGGLNEAQAVIVVEIAKTQARLRGGTEDFLVTREFRQLATEEERVALMRCCFIVAAGDSISAGESAVLAEIANELDLTADQITALRSEFTDHFAAVQAMRAQIGR